MRVQVRLRVPGKTQGAERALLWRLCTHLSMSASARLRICIPYPRSYPVFERTSARPLPDARVSSQTILCSHPSSPPTTPTPKLRLQPILRRIPNWRRCWRRPRRSRIPSSSSSSVRSVLITLSLSLHKRRNLPPQPQTLITSLSLTRQRTCAARCCVWT